MAKLLCALFVLVCVVVAKGDDLKCYQCQDCAEIPNGALMTCIGTVTTTQPVTIQSTATPTTTITTKPTTITTEPTPIQTKPTSITTTPSTTSVTTPTSDPITTAPATTTTAPATTLTAASVTTSSPVATPIISTEAPETAIPTSNSSSISSQTTTATNQETTPSEPEATPELKPEAAPEGSPQVTPEVAPEVIAETGTEQESPQEESAAALSSPYQQLPYKLSRQAHVYRRHAPSVRQVNTTKEYSCFYYEYTDTNGKTIVNRGCTQNLDECDGKEKCKLCREDGCNNSPMLHVSIWTTLLAIAFVFIIF